MEFFIALALQNHKMRTWGEKNAILSTLRIIKNIRKLTTCGEKNMKKVKITVMKMARYDDLISTYENPIEHACDVTLGQIFYAIDGQKPDGFCASAWDSLAPFVKVLAEGGGNFYDGWMKNSKSAMISCNDGFRPVSFLLETVDDDL